jgi:ornithine decarboxylase
VSGVSFHVGTELRNPREFLVAIRNCHSLFHQAAQEGMPMNVVDIGGGFPCPYALEGDPEEMESLPSLDAYFRPIREAIEELFPQQHALEHDFQELRTGSPHEGKAILKEERAIMKVLQTPLGSPIPGVTILAEPGRFISASCMTSISRVVSKAWRLNKLWVYLDESTYNSFAEPIRTEGKLKYPMFPLAHIDSSSSHSALFERDEHHHPRKRAQHPALIKTVLAGATCDSDDIIYPDFTLPRELAVGEIMVATMMGAYSIVGATEFNGFEKAKVVVVD